VPPTPDEAAIRAADTTVSTDVNAGASSQLPADLPSAYVSISFMSFCII
jgi:hypothetical protein